MSCSAYCPHAIASSDACGPSVEHSVLRRRRPVDTLYLLASLPFLSPPHTSCKALLRGSTHRVPSNLHASVSLSAVYCPPSLPCLHSAVPAAPPSNSHPRLCLCGDGFGASAVPCCICVPHLPTTKPPRTSQSKPQGRECPSSSVSSVCLRCSALRCAVLCSL